MNEMIKENDTTEIQEGAMFQLQQAVRISGMKTEKVLHVLGYT